METQDFMNHPERIIQEFDNAVENGVLYGLPRREAPTDPALYNNRPHIGGHPATPGWHMKNKRT